MLYKFEGNQTYLSSSEIKSQYWILYNSPIYLFYLSSFGVSLIFYLTEIHNDGIYKTDFGLKKSSLCYFKKQVEIKELGEKT